MFDIHSHLLFNVDDGSKSIESSVRIITDLYELGYKGLIITPHYITDSNYDSDKKNNIKILNEIKKEIKNNNIDIDLYLGNEIFIDYNILDLLKKNKVSSLNDSKYLLIELPMSGEFEGYIEVFTEIINAGYKVILAHPERYLAFQKDYKKVKELYDLGIYFQSNLDSINGGYGKKAKKLVKRLFKEHKISFLATDIHHRKRDYTKWEKSKKKILKYINNDEYNKLIIDNPLKVINNRNV